MASTRPWLDDGPVGELAGVVVFVAERDASTFGTWLARRLSIALKTVFDLR
jgi:hypothetical protein